MDLESCFHFAGSEPELFNKKVFLKGWAGDLAGIKVGEGTESISFEYILGKIFIPLAYIMGVPSVDCEKVARLVGLKTVVNEFAAYQRLGELVKNNQISPRAEVRFTLPTLTPKWVQRVFPKCTFS